MADTDTTLSDSNADSNTGSGADSVFELLHQCLTQQLGFVYRNTDIALSCGALASELLECMRIDSTVTAPAPFQNHWDADDVILITYGDSVITEGEKPLATLRRFLDEKCGATINSVHILPFFPYSSDDGFAVIDYSTVNEALGDWRDINAIADKHKLMADLVINHCSSRSYWFENFIKGEEPGLGYFFTSSPDLDYSSVVRPRTSPLLRETVTANGVEHVWCTFSHDQVDLDFRNPEVLIALTRIIRLYLDQGVKIFRFDAIAFIWKEIGTSCINLPETHELVRILRALIEHAVHDAVIITETNIPNRENLDYFGNANEAHCVYNFSLPPLLVNTLITGDCRYLKQWMMSMPPAQNGTAYFNFIASHDGIGLRPVEGLLDDSELDALIATMTEFGGRISWRALENGESKPYEINIALFDALSGTTAGKDQWGEERFLCAHAIMLALEGIPGIYIHSLLATNNDYEKLEHTSHNRSINRHQWDYEDLLGELENPQSHHHRVFEKLTSLIDLRRRQSAFHPNATQFTLHLGGQLFGFWRQSMDRRQSIFCISNVSSESQTLSLSEINLIGTNEWVDLISRRHFTDFAEVLELTPYQTLWISNRW